VLVCSFSCTFVHGVSVGFLVGGNYPDQPESGMGAEASLLLEAKPTKSRSNRMSANDPGCVKTPTSNLRVESLSRLR
jgi:hypothetical protein